MQYKNYEGITCDVIFKCESCGCRKFQRPSYYLQPLTFLEGCYECSNCQEEFNYADEAFTLMPSQLNLFE